MYEESEREYTCSAIVGRDRWLVLGVGGPTFIDFFLNGHTKYIQITNYDKTLEMCGTSSIR
jgi:hypothetical protein